MKKENVIVRSLKSFGKTLTLLFSFGKKKEYTLEELLAMEPTYRKEDESVLSPTKIIVRNFMGNKLAVFGLIWFIALFLFIFVGSALYPINLHETEPVMQNLKPGIGYSKIPSKLNDKRFLSISSGVTFSIGLAEDGDVYAWGQDVNGVLNVPEAVNSEKIIKVAAGDRHALVLTEGGKVYAWGKNDFNQGSVPQDILNILQLEKAVDIFAGDQYSGIITNKNKMYVWGSVLATRFDIVPSAFQGRISDVAPASFNILILDVDGNLGIMGQVGTQLDTSMPSEIRDGSVKLEQIAITLRTAAGIDANGKVHVWGERTNSQTVLPDGINDSKIVEVVAGMNHFLALSDDGEVFAWGGDRYGQASIPKELENTKVTAIFADYFQSYAVTEDGKTVSWGNNGYLLGTDELGRDMVQRLLHGGRVSMTVGAVAVLISTVIGLIVGLISGFYGGWIDNLLMRFTEVINSFPFLPLAVTLSAFMQGRLTQTQRLYMIMFILGVISWTGLARLVRGQILAEREKDFVLAARALGLRESSIIMKHILPNIINVVIVSMTLGYAGSLLTEAGLSFLGFGVVPPSPSWGNMLTSAQQSSVIQMYWWRWILPALFVLMAALSVNIVGDGLRDAMDPKSNEK